MGAVQHKYLEAFLSVHIHRLLSPLPAWADDAGFLHRLWSAAKVGGSPAGGEGSSNELWEAGYRGPWEARESPEKGSGCVCVCVCVDALGQTLTARQNSTAPAELQSSDTWSHTETLLTYASMHTLVVMSRWVSGCLAYRVGLSLVCF